MNWQSAALGMAGAIGSAVAIIHGMLVERLMIGPFEELSRTHERISAPIRRIVPLLLHFSTVVWFFGGLALIAAAIWFDDRARLATGLFVGSLYLYGAIGNLWGTRGFHPGWMLLTVALILIAIGIGPSGS